MPNLLHFLSARMKTSIPEAEYERLRTELTAARERFVIIRQLIDEHYGDRSGQASRTEQIIHSIERLQTELTRFDDAPPAKTSASGTRLRSASKRRQ
jgi:hypothetical protein